MCYDCELKSDMLFGEEQANECWRILEFPQPLSVTSTQVLESSRHPEPVCDSLGGLRSHVSACQSHRCSLGRRQIMQLT